MGHRRRGYLRSFCIVWSVCCFLAWAGATVLTFIERAEVRTPEFQWFRTGALLAGWAGVFAWKALEPPDR